MKLYVRGKSKKEINERLAAGQDVFGDNYSMFGGGGTYQLNGQPIEQGTVIAVYEKEIAGNPVAKSYGTWDAKKGRVK